jgi:hypothetical protein
VRVTAASRVGLGQVGFLREDNPTECSLFVGAR